VFRTNKDAPNYRLIVIDFDKPEEANWTTLVPEHERNVLEWATCVNYDKLVVCYMEVWRLLTLHDMELINNALTRTSRIP